MKTLSEQLDRVTEITVAGGVIGMLGGTACIFIENAPVAPFLEVSLGSFGIAAISAGIKKIVEYCQ